MSTDAEPVRAHPVGVAEHLERLLRLVPLRPLDSAAARTSASREQPPGSQDVPGRRSREPEAGSLRPHGAAILQRPELSSEVHVDDSSEGSGRRTRRHRVLGRPRHQRRAALDAREGRHPLRLHRQPRPARRTRLRRDSAQGARLRRREGAPHRLPRAAGQRGHRRAAVRRLPHHDRRRPLLQHHAARPRRHRHDARAGDARRRRAHLGRRQHVQGQRHRALLPLRAAGQPGAAHLQAVARSGVHRRARRPQGDVRVHGAGRASPTR